MLVDAVFVRSNAHKELHYQNSWGPQVLTQKSISLNTFFKQAKY